MTDYFRIHAEVEWERKREHSQSREEGIQWEKNLRSDLQRMGMCQLEMFLAGL